MTRENIEAYTLLSHMMKLQERILDGRIRAVIWGEIDEKQLEYRQRKGTKDGMFALR